MSKMYKLEDGQTKTGIIQDILLEILEDTPKEFHEQILLIMNEVSLLRKNILRESLDWIIGEEYHD